MKRILLRLLLFCICVATSFFIKTCHYNMEAARVAAAIGDAEPLRCRDFRDALPAKRPNFVPYTIESAMMFAYAKDIADGKGVPAHDPRLAYLPDVAPYAQMNMGLEWVLGWSYRLKCLLFPPAAPSAPELRYQDSPDFAAFTAWNVRLWTAFIPGLIFLWLLALRTPAGLAFSGGMLHAVAASAIARATGQDIVRGDLCIPLILLSMVLAYSFYARPKRWKLAALFGSTFFCFVTCRIRGVSVTLRRCSDPQAAGRLADDRSCHCAERPAGSVQRHLRTADVSVPLHSASPDGSDSVCRNGVAEDVSAPSSALRNRAGMSLEFPYSICRQSGLPGKLQN